MPDGGGDFDLLGQEELAQYTFDTVVAVQAAKHRALLLAGEAETTRLAEQSVRLGQHRFARSVLENYGHTCAFCGFSPQSLPRHKLLVASHIKPWAQCDSRERLDVRNGVTACGVHDAAFDTGLITVNGGLRVHLARKLQVSVRNDPGADNYFGTVLRSTLILPADSVRPGKAYLEWHQQQDLRRRACGRLGVSGSNAGLSRRLTPQRRRSPCISFAKLSKSPRLPSLATRLSVYPRALSSSRCWRT